MKSASSLKDVDKTFGHVSVAKFLRNKTSQLLGFETNARRWEAI